MAAPKLIYAAPNGQTAVIVVFDQPMRQINTSAMEDPSNPLLWATTGGLPQVSSVIRRSNIEFELLLASAAPLGAGYGVTVSDTVQSATGEVIDPGFVSKTFDVTVADLTVASIVWNTPTEVDFIFSENLATIVFDNFSDVISIQPSYTSARQLVLTGVTQSGSTLRVSIEAAGTSGALYVATLNREVFQSLATGVTLRAGQEVQNVYGQGAAPSLTSLVVKEDLLQVSSTETLGKTGWPLTLGTYALNEGTLGKDVDLGTAPSILSFPSASLPVGDIVQFSVARTTRTVLAGTSFSSQATSVIGAGSETVGVGTTTLNKTSGAPFELAFSGGVDGFSKTGRSIATRMHITFPSSSTVYPLLVFTFLSTQVSVVLTKTANNLATARLYRGANPVTPESTPFDPSSNFNFEIVDATAEYNGFLSVVVNNIVLVGAPAKDLIDPTLANASAGATAFALVLGSPSFPSQTFSVVFPANLTSTSYLSTGLLGIDSHDLMSFPDSIITGVVQASSNPPLSPGFQNTGKPAFGISAEYKEAVDAVMVVIGLNQDAVPQSFTGSVSLLTSNQQVLDQILFDQSYVTKDTFDEQGNPLPGNEVIVVFLHPRQWLGVLTGVTLTIGGSDYSAIVAVVPSDQPAVTAQMTQQPASWWIGRSPKNPAAITAFGPATVMWTP